MTRKVVHITPAQQTRADRRARELEIRTALRDASTQQNTRDKRGLPEAAVPGPFGPGLGNGGYWNLAPIRVQGPQATPQHLAGIYPVVADTGLGTRGPHVGGGLNPEVGRTSGGER